MATSTNPWLLRLTVAVLLGGGVFLGWQSLQQEGLPEGFASSNGRIEAVEIDIAAKTAGRVEEVLVDEGDFVERAQLLARMNTDTLRAELREAKAQRRQADIGVETARSQVTQREAEKDAARAVVAQRQAELEAAEKRLARTRELAARGNASIQALDDNRAAFEGAKAALSAARAELAATDAAINYARAQVVAAESQVEAVDATIERIQADIDDSALTSPRDGRVQYRVAQPGEVLSAGGAVLNLVDLTDVYMTFFLPTADAGRVALGAEARIVLDAAPQYVIPAEISFVADVAQFTPKTVETAEERQKLMFRVKAQIPSDLLKRYIRNVKTGLPGMAYVRLNESLAWPDDLQVKLPND